MLENVYTFVKKGNQTYFSKAKYDINLDTLDDLKLLKGMRTFLSRSHPRYKIAPSSISFRKNAVALKSAVLSSY